MPTVMPPDPENEFTEDDWLELVATTQPGGGDAFSIDSASAVLVGIIPARKRLSAMNYILGYATADTGTPYGLYRVNPKRHPAYPFLVAKSVRFQQRDPAANPDNAPDFAPYKDALDPGYVFTRQAAYHYATCTVEFGLEPMTLWDDNELGFSGLEYDRNTVLFARTNAVLEILSAEANGRYLRFIEGPANNPNGREFPGQVNEYMRRTNFQILWKSVPESYTHKNGRPVKILDAVGTVNEAEWLGFPPMTLLWGEPEFRRFQIPLMTTDLEGVYANDVLVNLTYFDPASSVPNPVYRGFNLMPWVHGGGVPINDGSGGGPGWYSVEREDSSPYIPTSDFDVPWEHHGF